MYNVGVYENIIIIVMNAMKGYLNSLHWICHQSIGDWKRPHKGECAAVKFIRWNYFMGRLVWQATEELLKIDMLG